MVGKRDAERVGSRRDVAGVSPWPLGSPARRSRPISSTTATAPRLTHPPLVRSEWMIANPPFRLGLQFTLRALALATEGRRHVRRRPSAANASAPAAEFAASSCPVRRATVDNTVTARATTCGGNARVGHPAAEHRVAACYVLAMCLLCPKCG
jgi:hypothetical protein